MGSRFAKSAALLSLALILFVSPSTVLSQVPDDKLIVPGQRIGKWKLEMTADTLAQLNGPPMALPSSFYQEAHQGGITMRVWPALGLAVATRENRVEYLVVSHGLSGVGGVMGPIVLDYETEKVEFLAQEEEIPAAYGRPTATTQITLGLRRLTYDEIGLAFRVAGGSGVISIAVFRPGTARTIWRL